MADQGDRSIFTNTLNQLVFEPSQPSPNRSPKTKRILAFTALQMRASEARNNLFAVNATSWTRRELAPNIDVSPTLVWSPNGQRVAFVSGDTDIYTVNADGSRLTKQFAEGGCKAPHFEIAWFSNSQKLVFARSCDGFTSDDPGSQSLYTSNTSGIKGTKLYHFFKDVIDLCKK
ncbi:MAG: hypothetical protein KY448_07410 [Cyanobacteria bacterium 0813]|nr:hypothetical protein [Cyanobacteria bacterium 0813]